MIKIPKLLRSLTALSLYKLGTHVSEDIDQQKLDVRSCSRQCLSSIQDIGDAQIQIELVNIGYGRVMSLSFCTTGGIGEEQVKEINVVLIYISDFLRALHEGRNEYWYPQFQPLPLLARRTEEQLEEEGANEELEAQISSNGLDGYIKKQANKVKAETLNCFIHSS
ncbi:MAG: hypothetical protein EZS28_036769 [Streblomastix strix]|uniref:Uncharacterized protein n=1 Tax=Streblomastix strix TaxID=222440 RepID=A0A5J4UDP1_9EUKA|nr:MAG: hypothetical protein EZS28_036769 [Streblomastix strix]